MDTRIADRLTALFTRKIGNEETAGRVVGKIMEQLASKRAEPSSERRAETDRGPLANGSTPGGKGGSPIGASRAPLDGMKSGGKESPELQFERFIASAGAPTIAQASEPLNSANRSLINLTDAFQSMPPELRQEYGKPFPNENSISPSAYLMHLQKVGSLLLSRMERDEEPIEKRDEIIGISGEIRELFAEPQANPGRLLELVVKLHDALNATADVDDIFSE